MKNTIKSLVCAAAVLAVAAAANANSTDALRYSIDNGATWTTILDAGSSGFISTTIVGGGFNLTVSATGSSSGTLSSPSMDLGLNGHTTGAGTLIVEYSDLGFTPVSAGSYTTTFFGNGGVTSSERTILGANTLFASANVPLSGGIGPIGPFITGSGTSSAGAPAGLTAPYSITLVEVLTSTGSGQNVSVDAHLTVPDGGNTLVLLGSALSVLGMAAFRRKTAVANA